MGLMNFINYLDEKKAKETEEAENQRLVQFYGDYKKDPNTAVPKLSDPNKIKGIEDFISQQADKRGTEAAFKELAPFIQPSLASNRSNTTVPQGRARGEMPSLQQFTTDAFQHAQGQGLDMKYALPVINQLKEQGSFQAPAAVPTYKQDGGQLVPNLPGFQAEPIPNYRAETKPPEYDIKQDANGAFYHVPKSPGAAVSPVGLSGQVPKPSNVAVTIDNGKREQGFVDQASKGLENLSLAARSSNKSLGRIREANTILDRGGDGVTGMTGAIKAALQPAAKAIGINIESMNDSQILSSLLSEGAGSLRMDVIGPGPVSNFEQDILQKVSGKTISAAEGVRQILKWQQAKHEENIEAFNERINAISKIPGYEAAAQIYPAIKIDKVAPTTQKPDPLGIR